MAAFDASISNLLEAVNVAAKAVQAKHAGAPPAPAPVQLVIAAPAATMSAFRELESHLRVFDSHMETAADDMVPVIQGFVGQLPPDQQESARATAAAAVAHVTATMVGAHFKPLRRWATKAQADAAAAVAAVPVGEAQPAAAGVGGMGSEGGAPSHSPPPSPRARAPTRPLGGDVDLPPAKTTVVEG